MKVLLIDPKRINLETYLIIPNLGIGYLATALRRAGHDVAICNAARDSLLPEHVAQDVAASRYDAVCITIFTPYFTSAAKYAAAIRRRFPEVHLLAGGPHAIFEPEEVFDFIPEFDYVCTGEGEETLPLLLAELEKNDTPPAETLEKIPNLCFRDGDEYRRTGRRIIEDIRPLDLPAWDLMEPQKFALYPNGIFTRRNRVAPIVTSRGCPFPCRFCGAGRAMGKKVRQREPESVVEEIKLLRDQFDIHEIQFMDDNFTVDRDFAMRVCELMIEQDLGVDWGCPPGVRLDCIDDELVRTMKRAGCYSTSVGIESGSQRVLDLMKKKIRLEDVPGKISMLRRHGIRITGLFILGFPGETVEEMRETVRLSLQLDLNRVNLFPFTPFPGSDIYDKLKAEGKLKGLSYDETYIHNLSYCHESIPEKELIRIQRMAHFKFYLRPRIIWGILREIHSLTQFKIVFQRAMKIIFPGRVGEHYHQNEISRAAHTESVDREKPPAGQ